MAGTYEKIDTNLLTSAVGSFAFTSIPGTYTDLIIMTSIQGQSNGANVQIWFNNDGAGTAYSNTVLYSASSTAYSGRTTNAAKINFGTNGGMPFQNANQFGTNIWNIQNYSNATTYKTVFGTSRSPNGGYLNAQELDSAVGIWRNTAPITQINIGIDNSKLMQPGSRFTIYGIKAA